MYLDPVFYNVSTELHTVLPTTFIGSIGIPFEQLQYVYVA